jgi:hypothetical protein
MTGDAMNCEDALDRIDAGETDDAALRAHLATCAGCREAQGALERIGAAARALPRELEPGRDLWPAIAGRLAPPAASGNVTPFRPRRTLAFAPATLAAAAVLLIALTAAFTALLLRVADPVEVAGGAAGDGVARPVSLSAEASVAAAEAEYVAAQAALLERIHARADALGPDTLATVETNLKVIDAALAEIRTALGRSPGNPALVRMLTSTHRKKLDALQRVATSL